MSAEVPPEPRREVTANQIDASPAQNIVQARDVGGMYFTGIPGADLQPGLVSTIPPTERLTSSVYGRDHLIAHLLNVVQRADGSTVVLHGTGGSGKTAVALEVANRLARDQQAVRVWWVNAASKNALSAGLREVARDADAPVDDVVRAWSGSGSAPNVVRKALANAPRPWLLIIDNADDSRVMDKWRSALRQSTGTVLVTTRNGKTEAWAGTAEMNLVGPLAEEAAVEMLCALAPESGTQRQARELACTLGYLPLALRLAGRYLNAAQRFPTAAGVALPENFDQYRSVFHNRFGELDRMHEIGSGLGERELLSRTWELSLDLLAEHGMPWARPLLRWLSCFEQAPIPCDLANAQILGLSPLFEGMSGMDVIHAFLFLTDFGLVEQVSFSDVRSSAVRTKCWLLHPVIREATRHQPDVQRDLQAYLALCIATLDGFTCYLSTDNLQDLSTWAALSPHCEYVVDWIHRERASLPGPEQWELLGTKLTCAVARFAQLSGVYPRAERLFQHALTIRLRSLGENHPEVLAVRRHLALLRWDRDQSRQSITEFVALAKDCRAALGESDPFTLACRLDLALKRTHFGDAETVVDDYRDIVRVSRELYGHTEATGLSAQMNLATELWYRKDESCAAELWTLLAMTHEVDSSPGAAEQLPFRLERLQATVVKLLDTYQGWRDFLGADGWPRL